jgi:hypothetical protein
MGLALVENLAALGAGAVSPVQGPPRLGRADGKISSDRPSFGCALFRAARRSAREARGEARFGADEREHSLFAWTKGLSGDAREGDTESVSVRAPECARAETASAESISPRQLSRQIEGFAIRSDISVSCRFSAFIAS